LFVADFVGQVNALPGRVMSYAGGRACVEIFGRKFVLSVDKPPPRDVLVLVRPEAVRLADAAACALCGVLEDLEYRGDRIEYRIRLGDTLLVAVEAALGRRDRIAPGDRVGFELVEEALHLLPATAVRRRPDHSAAPGEPKNSTGTTL